MAIFSATRIEELETQLTERMEKLKIAMHGRALNEGESQAYTKPKELRAVKAEAVRIAVDDFATILRAIKSSLGK